MFHLPVEVSALWMELEHHGIHCRLSPSGWDFRRPRDQLCKLELGNFVHTGPQPVSLKEEKGKIGERIGQLHQMSSNVHGHNFLFEGRIGEK